MLPPSLAIGWTIWRRHRWGLSAVLAYVLTAAAAAAVLPVYFTPPMCGVIATILMTPLTYVAMYLMGVFSYGFEADLNARPSCFPAALFTLPVRTGALAGWPIAFGALAVILLWLAAAGLILRPSLDALNMAVPLWWPAVLAMATLAALQAVLWSSFGLPALRIVLATIVICGMITVAQVSAALGVTEGILVGSFSGAAGVSWLIAHAGVRGARRGDVPNWEGVLRPFRLRGRRQQPQPFASPARAQVWFEWRRTGMSLPFMTALILPFVLFPLLLGPNEVIPISQTLASAIALPVLFGGIAGTTVSGKHAWVKDYYGVALSTATLPLSTAGMVAAKLRAAAWSTLAAWVLLAVTVPLAVTLTGNWDDATGRWHEATRDHHPARIVAGITAGAVLLFVWSWKNVVNSLFLGLTGRKWVIQGTLILGMAGFVSLWLLAVWIYHHPETHETVFTMLPWLLALLALCRLAATGWALRRGVVQSLFTVQTVSRWIAAWFLLAALLVGLLAWSVPLERVPFRYIILGVVLILPMTRLACTPLALAWNRHR